MIIIGYQGIGKTTLCKNRYDCIDLESSALKVNGIRADNWYEHYCMIARWLSKQGYTVFLSSHKEVRMWLDSHNENYCAIVPATSLQAQWLHRLEQRMKNDSCDKNIAAFMNAKYRYIDNVNEISADAPKTYIITDMQYILADIVADINSNN